jgi:hypothetical protein
LDNEAYAAAESRISQWRRDSTHSVGSELQRGLRELGRERAQLTDLRSEVAGAHNSVETATQLHADSELVAEAVHTSVAAADERAQALARTRDELLQQRDVHLEALRREEQEIATQRQTAEERQAEAERLLNTYRDRLGFAITREAPQTVRMTFSLLDKADPAREFAFILGIAQGEEHAAYEVSNCVPMVPELRGLLADLNHCPESAVALPRFVCSMRKAFFQVAACTQPTA